MCCVLIQNTLYVSLSTQEYNWVAELSQGSLVKCRGGGGGGGGTVGWAGSLCGGGGGGGGSNQGMDWHPVWGESGDTPSCFMQGNKDYKLRAWTGHCSNTDFTKLPTAS